MSTDSPGRIRGVVDRPTAVDPRRSLPEGRPARAGPDGRGRTAREIALGAEVSALEAELDRRERRLREVLESYESLLAEQARAGREADAFAWSDGSSPIDRSRPTPGLLARLRARLPAF